MHTITINYKELDRDKWSDFVNNHPNGNIFHTPEMVEIYEKNAKNIPVVITCLDPEKRIKGILIAVIIQQFTGILGSFTARAIVWGGPLIQDQDAEISSLILAEFDLFCKKRAVFAQFRNLWDINSYSALFSKQGYIFEEHLDILFNLNLGKDELWKGMNPTRRKQINRGQKRDIQTLIVNTLNEKELTACFEILKQVYTDVKLPYPKLDYFKNALEILHEKEYFKASLAYYNTEIVGFRFFLCYNGLLYDWYAGSKKEHYDKYPNDILPWSIMCWGIENGFNTFDFGGAGKPGVHYGVRDYKLKFGGQLVNFGRYEKIYKPAIYYFAFWGLKLWQKISAVNKKRK